MDDGVRALIFCYQNDKNDKCMKDGVLMEKRFIMEF